MRRFLFVLALAVGCTKEDTDNGTIGADDTDEDVDCNQNRAPVVEEFTVEPDGMSEGDECGDDIRPYILFQFDVTDEDGDLNQWRIQLWWDEVIDDDVSTDDAPISEIQGSLEPDFCDAKSGTVGVRLCVTGNPPFQTEMEFGGRVRDASDNPSELQITTFTTPDEDGNY